MRRRTLALIGAALITAITALSTYPPASAWLGARQDAAVLTAHAQAVTTLPESDRVRRLDDARRWNLTRDDDIDPASVLAVDTPSGLIGSLSIPATGQVLPMYYGDDDQTLKNGVGVVPGSSLPVGGVGTRSVISGHSGLPSRPLFTDLHRLSVGDTFSVTVLSHTLTYRVVSIDTVTPDDVAALKPEEDRDLVTLLTCTPIGINSHRLLVTGERVADEDSSQAPALTLPEPGFPWWAVGDLAGLTVAATYMGVTVRGKGQLSEARGA